MLTVPSVKHFVESFVSSYAMISDEHIFSNLALPSHTFMLTFDYMHSNTCMYFIVLAVIMSVFSSPTGSPG